MPPENRSNSQVPRMIDVARRAGVSRMAVSAVLMGTGEGRIRVSPKTATRIRAAAQEIGYRPNRAAQQLAGKKSGVVAIIARDWQNFLTQKALAWMQTFAESFDLKVLAVRAYPETDAIYRTLEEYRSGWVDGVVYLAHENESQWPELVELLRGQPCFVTAIGSLNIDGVPRVINEVQSGAVQSLRHLHERGFRRPVFVTEQLELGSIPSRLDAYLATASELGMDFGRKQVIVATRDWLVNDPKFAPLFDELAHDLLAIRQADSILCDTDFTAAGLLKAIRHLGYRVPEECAVVGWGNLQFSAFTDPALTTVSYDLPTLLERAMSQLKGLIEQHSPKNDTTEVATELVIRESA
ncbi:LacI family DNA-binding transcriptional regulator [Thalassoroseus pseudoceratinae]|uniref:LacI family DNA-binding transcriptional regulator n=1 Tax=Thalassoroseus pseudoceratinae TaxID=2713176 RepID=UPI001422A7F3|nr:LacI family DNA-binding transcriptional regulator [Thalassoroseus pseudoceratinae]